MTQVRLLPKSGQPGTHALVIGVGYYQHLRGGPAPNPVTHLGLNVLTSPPVSAMAFANWLVGPNGVMGGGLNNPAAPLTTVDVCVSAQQAPALVVAGAAHAIEPASVKLVKDAFDRWLIEVQSHPNNVGVLYFCGHGVIGTGPEHILLLDDYGASDSRPFEGSFDMSNTMRALRRQVPAQLYVFVDACRSYAQKLGTAIGVQSVSLLHEQASSASVNSGSTMLVGSLEGASAYGQAAGVSRFTEALLQALGGYCGTQKPGSQTWFVNGGALMPAVPKLLDIINRMQGGQPQTCHPDFTGLNDAPLHFTSQMPKVKVEIELEPENQRMLRSYAIHDLVNQAAAPIKGGKAAGIWQTEACKGIYEVRINSKIPYTSGLQFFDPPHYHLPVEVQP